MKAREREEQRDKLLAYCRSIEPPLPGPAIELTARTMGILWEKVLEGEEVTPQGWFLKNGRSGLIFAPLRNDLDKDKFAGVLRNLRRDCEVVVFGFEAWTSRYDKRDYDQGHYVPPRLDPDRTEACLINVWLRDGRSLIFNAAITRKPKPTFSAWELASDSAKGQTTEGRFT
jgi:hypothetical protein